MKIEDFIDTTVEDEFIDYEATPDMAIDQLVQEKHPALMVTQDDNTIGVLRLADDFIAVYHTMAECSI